jgi:hypothetical protein
VDHRAIEIIPPHQPPDPVDRYHLRIIADEHTIGVADRRGPLLWLYLGPTWLNVDNYRTADRSIEEKHDWTAVSSQRP